MIWLLRHGEAAEGSPDSERPLTAKGEEQSRAAGLALAALGVKLDACLTSPKVRAYETARLACEPLGLEPRPQFINIRRCDHPPALLLLLQRRRELADPGNDVSTRRQRETRYVGVTLLGFFAGASFFGAAAPPPCAWAGCSVPATTSAPKAAVAAILVMTL